MSRELAASPVQASDFAQPGVSHRSRIAIAAAASLLLFMAVYLLRFNRVAGLVGDDAWYILLAKSLAEGQGFSLLSSPIPGVLPSYPPGFPFLLSLVFRVAPQFPENVWLLKAVSVAAMCGTGAVTYRYLSRSRQLEPQLARGAALVIVLMPAFVFLATSTVMSECIFTLSQMLTVVVIERCVERRRMQGDWLLAIAGAALASFTFLTRSVAIGLIAAALIYLLKERLWCSALIFAAAVFLMLAPWLLYVRAHAPTPEQARRHGGNIVYSYGDQFWMKRAGDGNSGRITWRELLARVAENAVDIAGRDVGGLILPVLFRGPEESGEEVFALGYSSGMQGGSMGMTAGTMLISLLLSAVVVIGFALKVRQRITLAELVAPVSLLITLIWPWWPFRFVLPLAPFLILYLLAGLAGLHALSRRWLRCNHSSLAGLRIFLFCVLGLSCYDHAQYLLLRQADSARQPEWLRNFDETSATLQWMREHLPPGAVIASNSPALVYLHTGCKSLAADDPAGNWQDWKRLGVRYVAVLKPYAITPLDNRAECRMIYSTSRLRLRVLDLNDPAVRGEWK